MPTSTQFDLFDELVELGYNLPGSEFVISALALDDQWRAQMGPTLRAGLIWCSLRKADLAKPDMGPNADAATEVVEGMLWDLAIPIVRDHLETDPEVFKSLGFRICAPPNPENVDGPDFEEALLDWTTFLWGAVCAVEAWALSTADDFKDAIDNIATPSHSDPELFAWITARREVWRAEELLQTPETKLRFGDGMTR